MKLSELIKTLVELKLEHGDMDVVIDPYQPGDTRQAIHEVRFAYDEVEISSGENPDFKTQD